MRIIFTSFRDSHLISLSGYNKLRKLADLPPLNLQNNETALYINKNFFGEEELFKQILSNNLTVGIMGDTLTIASTRESLPLVTDATITVSFALIVTDEVFDKYSGGDFSTFISAVLQPDLIKEKGLMRAIMETDEKLKKTDLSYESYLQNIGRSLFYIVAAGYITIYLALIFLVVANTIIGVLFLMDQRKVHKRYQNLFYLGATYETLCKASNKQINWYFGLPIVVAIVNSLFGSYTLFFGITSEQVWDNISIKLVTVAICTILVMAVVEYIYMTIVKKNSRKYLLSIIKPKRED